MIDAALLSAIGIDAATWARPLSDAAQLYGIDDDAYPNRAAFWLAQCAHETQGFTRLRENMDYRADRLVEVFGKRYFTFAQADDYSHQPERIANRVYANRFGNGDEASGDGWLFRGGGGPHLTFRENYRRCGAALGVDLENNPDLIEQPIYAALAGAWYWSFKRCDEPADAGNFIEVTRRFNGGTTGQDSRKAWLKKVTDAVTP